MSMLAPTEGAIAGERAWLAFDDAVSVEMGVQNASSARLVGLVRQCIDERHWEASGCRSPEHWVVARCGLSAPRAARLVRIAERIHEFPALEVTARQGLVTEDHLAVVASFAHAGHDAELAAAAPSVDVARLRRVIAALPVPDPEPGPFDDNEPETADPVARAPVDELRFGWGDDGRLRGRFDLGPVVGSVVEKALGAARSKLFREARGGHPDERDEPPDGIRWVDALERLAHAGLAGLDPRRSAGHRPADRYQVLVHVDAEHPERSRLDLGPLLPAADRGGLTCDADVRAVLWKGGRPVGFGRRQRVVDPLLRALIEDRDGGCRLCGRRTWVHVHHLVHWEHGGPTDPGNLVAACPDCHQAIHRGDVRILGDPEKPDGLGLFDRRGRPLPRPSPLPAPHLVATARDDPGPDRSRWC